MTILDVLVEPIIKSRYPREINQASPLDLYKSYADRLRDFMAM